MTTPLLPVKAERIDFDYECMTLINPVFTENWYDFKAGLKVSMISFYWKLGELIVHLKNREMLVIKVELMRTT